MEKFWVIMVNLGDEVGGMPVAGSSSLKKLEKQLQRYQEDMNKDSIWRNAIILPVPLVL